MISLEWVDEKKFLSERVKVISLAIGGKCQYDRWQVYEFCINVYNLMSYFIVGVKY